MKQKKTTLRLNRFGLNSARYAWLSWMTVCAIAVCVAPATSFAQTPKAQDEKSKQPPVLVEDSEVKLGRMNAEANDKQVRLVTDAVIVERVNRIGKEIATVANKTPILAKWGKRTNSNPSTTPSKSSMTKMSTPTRFRAASSTSTKDCWTMFGRMTSLRGSSRMRSRTPRIIT